MSSATVSTRHGSRPRPRSRARAAGAAAAQRSAAAPMYRTIGVPAEILRDRELRNHPRDPAAAERHEQRPGDAANTASRELAGERCENERLRSRRGRARSSSRSRRGRRTRAAWTGHSRRSCPFAIRRWGLRPRCHVPRTRSARGPRGPRPQRQTAPSARPGEPPVARRRDPDASDEHGGEEQPFSLRIDHRRRAAAVRLLASTAPYRAPSRRGAPPQARTGSRARGRPR